MILAVHRQEPNWPADPGRVVHQIEVDGVTYWAETDGVALPEADDVRPVVAPSLDQIKAARIDELRSDADARMSSRPIHAEKFAQALAYQANTDLPLSDVPLIEASIGFDGATAADVAAVIVEKYTAAVTHAAAVERARLVAERAIRNASTVHGVEEAAGSVAWPTP